jgi:hypothetical protein
MKLNSKALAVLIFVILFGGIVFTTAMNWWQTESSKVPAKFTDGEAAGEYNPADIRGSYTFGDIQTNFNVPAVELAAAFAIESDDPGNVALKDLEEIYATAAEQGTEVGTASVRLFVALYTGLPYEIDEDTYLPQPAVEILLSKNSLTLEQIGYLQTHTVTSHGDFNISPDTSEQPEEAIETEPVHDAEEIDRLVKGKTTFQEVLDWGVSQETIENILGMEMPNPLTKVKDFCMDKGLEFETTKTALQDEIDKITP